MENIYEIILDGEKLNDYMRGRISGFIYMLVRKPDKSFPWRSRETDNRWFVTTRCSPEVFKEIIETIEHVYPGVIINEES